MHGQPHASQGNFQYPHQYIYRPSIFTDLQQQQTQKENRLELFCQGIFTLKSDLISSTSGPKTGACRLWL